jgi:hypothetical protein
MMNATPSAMLPATLLTDRVLLRLSPMAEGEDVRGFLQGLVTSDVAAAMPQWGALLTPQGKCLFDFILWADGADVLIDCEREAAEALARRLTLYRLRRAIAIAPEPALAVHWAQSGGQGAVDPRLPALGRRWLAPAGEGLVPDEQASDAAPAYHAHRLSLGVTEGRAELGDGTTLWLECNAAELNGVSFTKGCYVGQENTARMNWRAKVNRRIVVVPLDQADAKRQIVARADLGLSIEHRRVEDIPADGWRDWMGPRPAPGDAAEVGTTSGPASGSAPGTEPH